MDKYLTTCIKLAAKSLSIDEVPIGAIVVDQSGQIIGKGYNKTHSTKDSTNHAELIAIRQAQKYLGDWRLTGCTIYVTLEPCLMCFGAIANSRISKLIYILDDPLFGSVESKLTLEQVVKSAPKLKVEKLPDYPEIAKMMKSFFQGLRNK